MRMTIYVVIELLENFSYLTEQDILACLGYAADREKSRTVA